MNNNIALTALGCGQNQLTSLDVNNNIALTNLYCWSNLLTSLDLSNNIALIDLDCQSNQLTSLLLKNGSIEAGLSFSYNLNLQYICADEGQLTTVQNKTTEYGYVNCVVNSNCSLSNDNFIENDFAISPNPTKDFLKIESKQNTEITSVTIYNILGQLVQVIPNAKGISNIDVSGLKTGSYFIKIISEKGSSSSKFVKE